MTTRKFSATDLPHPRYSLELGRLSIGSIEQRDHHKKAEDNSKSTHNTRAADHQGAGNDGGDDDDDDDGGGGGDGDGGGGSGRNGGDVNLPSTCLPRFSQLAQVIEVRKPGLTLPGRVSSNIKDFLGSYCVIENARPELFVRRDFISKFVDKGTIHISHLSDHQGAPMETQPETSSATPPPAVDGIGQSSCGAVVAGYKLSTRNNTITITMNAKQYHRFGLVAKKVISLSTAGPRKKSKRSPKGEDDLYLVEIDLRDERLRKNNKYQDRLVSALRRLTPINKVYFRFIPDKSKLNLSSAPADDLSVEFFRHVIEEYALDGCQPVPLTSCTIGGQQVGRNWVNYSQLHPELGLSKSAVRLDSLMGGRSRLDIACPGAVEADKLESALASVIEIIDWLGYQVLQLDCDHLSEILGWNGDVPPTTKLDRVDVSCTQIIGTIDFKQVQANLTKLFNPHNSDDVILRAMFLYDQKQEEIWELQSHNLEVGSVPSEYGGSWTRTTPAKSNSNNSGVIYIQDLAHGPAAAREITVVGMSKAG